MSMSRLSTAVLLAALAIVQAGAARPDAAPRQDGQGGAAQPAAGGAQGAAAPAEPPPPPPNQSQEVPIFRGGISYVRVDVIVSDRKQQPVMDLTLADFELTEDGKPQKVDQFRLVRVDASPKPNAPPPREIRTRADEEVEADRDDTRVFVIVLDDYHVRRANSISVREPLLQFIQNSLRPADMVAVMYPLTPVTDLSFTRNHASIAGAVSRFEGVKFDYRPRNQYEENISRYPTETVERIRNDITMGALRGLAVRLGSIGEGRKSIIFVSEGFTAMLPPQMRRGDASQPDNPIASQASAVGQDSSREQTAQWFGQSDVYSRLRDVTALANRNNAAIYSLDPRGLTPFEYGLDDPGGGTYSFATDRRALQMTQDTLRSLSEETDGRAIVNRNTLAQGLAQITRDSSAYYLLGYNTDAPTDGKFHKIEVKVKRRDVEVRARRGFWAATVADTTRQANPTPEIAKPVQLALAAISSPAHAGRYVRTWVGTERGVGGKTRLTFVWEALPATPGARRESPGRVSLLVADDKGSLVFRGRSPDAALAAAGPPAAPNDTGVAGRLPAASPATTTHRLVFDVPPGKTELRMTVEGAGGAGTLDQEIRSIDVPDLTTPQVAMSTPRVFRTRTVREQQTVSGDANAMPTTSREFSRTERLLVRLDAYGVGTENTAVTAVLMNRAGQKISDLTVAPATAGGTHQIDLGLNTVPPGEYVVEIGVKSGEQEVKDLIAFRISG
jgi:VWFA-related protein